MDIQPKELSLRFYSYLYDIIGTKEVVNKRRQILSVMDDRAVVGMQMTVSSGSKAEGLDLKGSDFDLMLVVNYAQVFEQQNHVKYCDKEVSLIMVTENVKPGFTKLRLHNSGSDEFFSSCVDRRSGCPYLSSTLYLDKILERHPGYYIHGPCASIGDIDHVLSLHCTNWISQALNWINRTKYSWASDEVIQNILCAGVLYVPIGSKNSPASDLEWRISFSYAEKQLITCFNHVQLLCYALLKILLNDIFKKSFGDLLCSYFMKTIMFWLCEETDVGFWRKENMLLCFMTCFRRLIYCVDNEICLHYFIPDNNLFENRFERHQKKLLSKLRGLYDLGWICLLQTETLQSFRGYLEPALLPYICVSTFLPSLRYLDITWPLIDDEAASITRCLFQSIRSNKKRDLYIYLISGLYQYFAQNNCNEIHLQSNNKSFYGNFRKTLSNLLIGLNHDAVSGWLLLASFYLTHKQYKISKILIDYSLTKFTSERCELLLENDSSRLQYYIEIQNIIGSRCLKNYTIRMTMIRDQSSIIPYEIKQLLPNYENITMPSIVIAHHLNFLFYQRVGDRRLKETSYGQLVFYLQRCEHQLSQSSQKTGRSFPTYNCAS